MAISTPLGTAPLVQLSLRPTSTYTQLHNTIKLDTIVKLPGRPHMSEIKTQEEKKMSKCMDNPRQIQLQQNRVTNPITTKSSDRDPGITQMSYNFS